MGGLDEWAIEKALEYGIKNSYNQIQKERTYRKDADAKTAETFKLMMELPYGMCTSSANLQTQRQPLLMTVIV